MQGFDDSMLRAASLLGFEMVESILKVGAFVVVQWPSGCL